MNDLPFYLPMHAGKSGPKTTQYVLETIEPGALSRQRNRLNHIRSQVMNPVSFAWQPVDWFEQHPGPVASVSVSAASMGTFYSSCEIANIGDRSRSFEVAKMLVDAGSEYTWVPRAELEGVGIAREKKDLTFVMANGQHITRSVGFAIVRVEAHFTVDEVVFAEAGDLLLLGARSLEGLNLSVDSADKKLSASTGPDSGRSLIHTSSQFLFARTIWGAF
jgi:predicted aspartyl protease